MASDLNLNIPVLEVLRTENCSQETTDTAMSLLLNDAPELVSKQLELEPLDFDPTYLMQLAKIIDFLQKQPPGCLDLPNNRIGMIDLLFEISRRLRAALKIPEWKIKGSSLDLKSPNVPILSEIFIGKTNNHLSGIPLDTINRIISDCYKEQPVLFYDFVESLRRGGIYNPQIFAELKALIIKVSPRDEAIDSWKAGAIGGEINMRLRLVCNIN